MNELCPNVNPGVCGIEHQASAAQARRQPSLRGTEADRKNNDRKRRGDIYNGPIGRALRGACYGVPFVNPVSSHRSARAGTPIASSAC